MGKGRYGQVVVCGAGLWCVVTRYGTARSSDMRNCVVRQNKNPMGEP